MSLYNRLIKEKDRLAGKALRTPKTGQELLDRKRWERVYTILTRRYEYERESFENELRGQDNQEIIYDASYNGEDTYRKDQKRDE